MFPIFLIKYYKANKRSATTCTCSIRLPAFTSTPNCSQSSVADCCPDVSVIEHICSQPPIVISRNYCDIDDKTILLNSTRSSSISVHSEPNMPCSRETQTQLNRTYDLTCKSSTEKSKTRLPTKPSSSTVDFAKEWLSNKTCELKHKIEELVYSKPKPCESKHVDFSSSCDLKHNEDPPLCQSDKSCNVPDEPCSSQVPCQTVKSFSYVDIADKLCELCKHVLVPGSRHLDEPCKHDDIAEKLCERCKHVLDSAPCPCEKTCKYCSAGHKFCNNCKYNLVSASSQPVQSFSYVDMAKKLCELCKHVLEPAPSGLPVASCRYVDVTDKLCERCKHVIDSAPCQPDALCTHCDISAKLCKECKQILNVAPCQSSKACKLVDIADKLCGSCKKVIEPDTCKLNDTCKHCDITKTLCKECKRVLDSTPCQIDKSCSNIAIADKLCDQCQHIPDSAPCRPIKTCKRIDISGKFCEICKQVVDPGPCKPVKSCQHPPGPTPCMSFNPCQYCDMTNKLWNAIPCDDRSCINLGTDYNLCGRCRHIDDSTSCPPSKSCLKHVDKADKSCEHCESDPAAPRKPDILCRYCGMTNELRQHVEMAESSSKECQTDPVPCKSVSSYKLCDMTDKACESCKLITDDNVSCIGVSCQTVDNADKPCENCENINDSDSCQPVKPCLKHVNIADKLSKQSKSDSAAPYKPDEPRENYDTVCMCKLCKDCTIIVDGISHEERSCNNFNVAELLCETCRHNFNSATCHLDKPSNEVEIAKELCKFDLKPSPCQFLKLCELVDVSDKSCKRCKDVPDSMLCQPVKSCEDVLIQVPEKGKGCEVFEELFFNDQAAGSFSAELWKCGKCSCVLESHSAETLTSLCPKIKQEAKNTPCDVAKESMCRSSVSGLESPEGSCASARARYYHNKLLATLQILQNKEETVRVQAESIVVAESRIAALNARHADLRREIERKEREIQFLRKSLKEAKSCRVDTCDVSLTTEIQDMDDQNTVVTTLQNNLDTIEELYRECFYESVKQENIIEVLRKSYLDVRLMEKEKSDRISKLHNVINTQKWSLDRCQDISAEVDSLKTEICNFINSSNNDSGMWEESVVSGLNEDLQDIAGQLLTLRDLLTGDCTCGLEQENLRLREDNDYMKGEIIGMRSQISAFEKNMRNNEYLDRQLKEQIEIKEKELNCIRGQLHAMMEDTKEESARHDSMTQQLTETKALLNDRSSELGLLQKQCRIYEDTINVLKEELNKTAEVTKENEALRKEACCVSRRAARVQRRAADLEAELARTREHCDHVDAAYREKTANAVELERQLDAAHARGAALCGEAGRVVRAVRCWAARMRDLHREQEYQIKQKECKLRRLENELNKRHINVCPRLWEPMDQSSPVRKLDPCAGAPSTSCSKGSKRSDGSCPTVTFSVQERRHDGTGSSGSEIASCSASPVPPTDDLPCSAAVPSCSKNVPSCSASEPPCVPRRMCKKKQPACGIKRRYGWLGPFGAGPQRDASAQHPTRCDAASHHACGACDCARTPHDATPRRGPMSPGEEMFSRMESLSAALADGYKRWSRRAPL